MSDALLAEVQAILQEAGIEGAEKEAAALVGVASERESALQLAHQRAAGKPLSHLLGRTRFMGVELIAEPGVFVVREETEILGWAAVGHLRERLAQPGVTQVRMIDMGSGTGNITCGIAHAVPQARFWACDIAEASVALTTKNVERHGLSERVSIQQGDLFASLAGKQLEGTIDVVTMNPPYIAAVRLEKDRAFLLDHEPREAFDGGPFGIKMHQRLIKESLPFLRSGGWLLFEFGVGQDKQVKSLFDRAKAYDRVEFATNAAGEPRVAMGRKA